MNWHEEDSVRRLYHGSKEGIKGKITTKIGNRHCDFGEGFYLTDTKNLHINWYVREITQWYMNLS